MERLWRPQRSAGFRAGMAVIVVVLVASACSTGAEPSTESIPFDEIDGPEIREVIAAADRPIVLNIWASWCIPCRSEAPLLVAAHEAFGDEVAFIGVAVEDNPPDAQAFIDEFGILFPNYLDAHRSVPSELGGFGVPLTYFVSSSGEISRHNGVIDERTLAINIDELLRDP